MSVRIVDTHCHIHDSEMIKRYDVSQDELIDSAHREGVETLVMIGTDIVSSREAVEFVASRDDCYATLAIHPHEAEKLDSAAMKNAMAELRGLYRPGAKIVAIGECGLDYFYHDDTTVIDKQKSLFRSHIELALDLDLPMSFHIRDAFEDFFAIIDEYDGVRGVVHSFTAGVSEMKECVDRGLYLGLNGIMTFTKDNNQLAAAKTCPLANIVVETDAPFLTPAPFRGKMCEPKHVRVTAEFLSDLRGESIEEFATATTANAQKLFGV